MDGASNADDSLPTPPSPSKAADEEAKTSELQDAPSDNVEATGQKSRKVTRCYDGCGSPNISETNNYYVCRSCGMTYSKKNHPK